MLGEDRISIREAKRCFSDAHVAITKCDTLQSPSEEPRWSDHDLSTSSATDLSATGGPCKDCLDLAKAQTLLGQAVCDMAEGRHGDALTGLEGVLGAFATVSEGRRRSSAMLVRQSPGHQRRKWHRLLDGLQPVRVELKAVQTSALLRCMGMFRGWVQTRCPRAPRMSSSSFTSLEQSTWRRRSKLPDKKGRKSMRWYRLLLMMEAKFALLRLHIHLRQADEMLRICYDVLKVFPRLSCDRDSCTMMCVFAYAAHPPHLLLSDDPQAECGGRCGEQIVQVHR